MKLAYVCDEYPPRPAGGIGTYVQTVAHAVAALGHDVTVVEWSRTPGERRDGAVRVVALPEGRVRYVSWLVRRRRLASWLAAEAFDLVEVPDFMGLLPFTTRSPVVVRIHGAETVLARHAARRPRGYAHWCEARTLSRHRAWLGVSQIALDRTREAFGIAPRFAAVAAPPVVRPPDEDALLELPEPFVLFAGEVAPRKGVEELAAAAAAFLSQHPDAHLVYAGRIVGDADERIRDAVGAARRRRVHFTGPLPRPRLFATLARAAVFAYPSPHESFGYVVAEAMLAGAPIVARAQAPFDEYLRDGETALLAADDEAFATHVATLLGDRPLAERLAGAARAHAGRAFTVDATLAGYEAALAAGAARR